MATPLASQIDEARKAGYSEDEILAYIPEFAPALAPKIAEAKTHEYSAADINTFLKSLPAQPSGTGSSAVDEFLKQVLTDSPFNPHNWGGMLSGMNPLSDSNLPWSPEHQAEAKRLMDAAEKSGNILPMITGNAENTPGTVAANLAGKGTNAALLGLVTAGVARGWQARGQIANGIKSGAEAATFADPAKDLTEAYGPSSDPRFIERAPIGLSDIRHNAGVMITSNEQLAGASPTQVVSPAIAANRKVWRSWIDPVEELGLIAPSDNILAASEKSLKSMSNPETRAALMEETRNQLAQQPLGAHRLEELLQEKNGELAPFYSKQQAVRDSAVSAGAVSGRSQAFLEAQAQEIRNELYRLADPQNDGAGPREVQRRFGNIKMISDQASDGATRNRINAETSGNPVSKTTKTALGALDALTSPLKEGGLAEGFLKLQEPWRGVSNPFIKRAFANAPEYSPLPEAPSIYDRYPSLSQGGHGRLLAPPETISAGTRPVNVAPGQRQTTILPSSGQTIAGGAPAGEEVAAALENALRDRPDGSEAGPGGQRTLGPATTLFQGSGERGTQIPYELHPTDLERTLPSTPDTSFVRQVEGSTEGTGFQQEAVTRRELAHQLFNGASYDKLGPRQKAVVENVIRNGNRLKLEDLVRMQQP